MIGKEGLRVIFDWYIRLAKSRHYQYAPCNFVPLVCGPSGAGKTYTIEQEVARAEEELGDFLPFIKLDSTAYTAYGWEGVNMEELVFQQLTEFKEKHQLTDSLEDILEHPTGAVIYIDEIDKILMPMSSGSSRAWQLSQQFDLLKLLDRGARLNLETKYKHYGSASCENILFIFSGAFEPLFKHKFQHGNKSIGFNASPKSHTLEELYNQELRWSDFEDFGAVPELLNRMTNLIQLQTPTEAEINQIYKSSYDVSIVKNLLGYTPPIEKCVELVQKEKLGARAIAREAYHGAMAKAANNCRGGNILPDTDCRSPDPKTTFQEFTLGTDDALLLPDSPEE